MERRAFRFFTKRSEHYNNLQKQEEEEKLNGIVNNNNQSSPLKDIPQTTDAVQKSLNGSGVGGNEDVPKSFGNPEERVGGENSEGGGEPKECPTQEQQPPTQEGSEAKKIRLKQQQKSDQASSPQNSHSQHKVQLANGKRHGSPSGSSNFKRIAPAPTSTSNTTGSNQHTQIHSNIGGKSGAVVSQANSERPLKCLETLAQKAGITFDEKYEVANTLIKLEKSQSPAQQPVAAQQPQPVPLTISQEQLQQLQQLQFHSAFAGNAIQVKQEFPHQAAQPTMQMSAEIKQQIVDAANQQHQQQQAQVQQMQVIDGNQAAHQQNPPSSGAPNAMGPPQTSTTISTMSPLHAMSANQVPAEWQHGRVQVLQQPIQNPAYLQQLYSPQVLMQGNILHSGLGQQQIQVIAAGKPFQSAPQMLATTAQGKPVIGSSAGGFSGAYALPTIPSSQSQTLLFSPVSVLSSQPQQQQQNLLSTMQNPQAGKPLSEQDMQKALSGQKVLQKVAASSATVQNVVASTTTAAQQGATQGGAAPGQQCVQVSQAMPTAQIISPLQQPSTQPMQFAAPWLQGVQQFWTTNGLPSQALLTQNPIIFRGAAQPDGSQSMFAVQPNPQAAAPQVIQAQPQNPTITLPCNMQPSVVNKQPQRVATETIAPKQPTRAAPILPQGAGGGGGGAQQIRPASSVSTQTQQNQVMLKPGKLRAKPHTVRPSAPGAIKGDAMIQAKIVQGGQVAYSTAQSVPQQTMHQVMTSAGSKMVVMSTNPGTPINIGATQLTQPTQQIQIATDKQPMQLQQQIQHQQKVPNPATTQRAPQVFQPQVVQHIQQLQQQMHQQPTGIQQQAFLQQAGSQQVLTVTAAGPQPTIQPKPSTMVIGTSQQHQIVADRNAVSTVAAMTSTSNPVQVVPSTTILNQVNAQLGQLATSNNLIGPLTSPQAPLQPPPNPLVAMTTLSTAPLSTLAMGNPPTPKDVPTPTTEAAKVPEVSAAVSKPAETVNVVTTSTTGATVTTETSTSSTISTVTVTSSGVTQPQETLSNGKSSTPATESPAKTPKAPENVSNQAKPESPLKDVAKTNGTMATVEAQEANGEVKTEKAVLKATVKPQVLTHVIEGFVIQEANEPFAVTRQRYPDRDASEEPPKKKLATEKGGSSPPMSPINSTEMACEFCGKTELKSKMKKKRFCSLSCAKASKETGAAGGGGGGHHAQVAESTNKTATEGGGVPVNGTDAAVTQEESGNQPAEEMPVMVRWSVAEVCDFIKNLPGCSDYAEDFAIQEIDGQALLLLKENHLVNAMGMKLGPALKIVAKVEALRFGTPNGEKEGQTQ
ncbi:polyhomeotic-proximal chromatin protein isoform X2 [Phlebotomus papatasi]|uniref:polyhomeotic-proximal chromatin protein isoform X2 n=1 Tax=Phlebotomus papatasi TaxID=29031 RepID=UPI00248392EA|nr:polyhomeotic-proximal chromatin protein isoform X2 [Phlebotomus papatasi]